MPVIRVLHIIDGFGAGGAETWLLSTVKYLKLHPELDMEFDFLATGGEPRIFDEQIQKLGSRIHYFKYSFKKGLQFRKFIRKILKDKHYDVIHDHQDFISGWHFIFALGSLPAIRIAHLHNPYNFIHNYVVNPGRWISFRVGRIITAILATKITGTSNAVMDEYGYNKWPYKIKRINPAYCGFDIAAFRFNANSRKTLRKNFGWDESICKLCLFVGRIGLHDYDKALNQKNPLFAFAIAKKLIEQHSEWRFLFVGFKGKLGNEMEVEIENKGQSDKIKFVGIRSDVADIMYGSDILIFPSFWEGLGMVAVEAQANGLPIIMSDTVPVEAVVCHEILTIKKIEEGEQAWVNSIAESSKMKTDRLIYNTRVGLSPFSIEKSIENLKLIYSY